MEYRMNRRTGDQISVLGLGTSSIASAGEREGVETLRLAFEQGINYFDLATALTTVQRSVDWQRKALDTDYIDYGFIHCLDEASDWEQYRRNGVLDYLLKQKEAGVVRHIGLSSHTPELVHQVLDTGLVDMLMFSINPACDFQHG